MRDRMFLTTEVLLLLFIVDVCTYVFQSFCQNLMLSIGYDSMVNARLSVRLNQLPSSVFRALNGS